MALEGSQCKGRGVEHKYLIIERQQQKGWYNIYLSYAKGRLSPHAEVRPHVRKARKENYVNIQSSAWGVASAFVEWVQVEHGQISCSQDSSFCQKCGSCD